MSKEVIFAIGDGSDYLENELYQTSFESKNYLHTIFTKRIWKGKVKITIENVDEEVE